MFRLTDEGKYDGITEPFLQWIDALPIATRVVAYCSFSSGADVADILELTIGRVRSQTEERFYLTGERMKAAKRKMSWSYKTFLSKEATKMLRTYIRTYRGGAKPEDFVFLQSRQKGEPQQLNTKNVQDIFRLVASNQGLINGNKNPFTTKRLRHAFTTACTAFAKLPSDAVDTLTGHQGGMGKGYLDKPKPIIVSFYAEVEKYVTIHGGTISKDVQDILSEYEDKLYLRDVRIERLETEKISQSSRIDGLEKLFIDLTKVVDKNFESLRKQMESRKPDEELERLKKEHKQRKD